jgi:4-amino-4-deoxy-L-arabinose transferase-like glycosyltransferase
MAIAYQTIGVHEWAVRLPSAVSAIALMGMVFYTLRRFGAFTETQTVSRPHELTALIGSSLVALHPLTIAWARTGVSDMLLTGCIGIALMAFFCGYAAIGKPEGNAFRWYVVCYLFVALAILTKGPVGIVLPGLVIAAFLCYVGNFKPVLREMRPFWGLLIILAIALPWYVLVTLANGEAFIHSFFGYHNIERFTEPSSGTLVFLFCGCTSGVCSLVAVPACGDLPTATVETVHLEASAPLCPPGIICLFLVHYHFSVFYHCRHQAAQLCPAPDASLCHSGRPVVE